MRVFFEGFFHRFSQARNDVSSWDVSIDWLFASDLRAGFRKDSMSLRKDKQRVNQYLWKGFEQIGREVKKSKR